MAGAFDRWAAGEPLVKDRPEAPDVGGNGWRGKAGRLFRRQEGRGAHRRAGQGQGGFRAKALRQAEVGDEGFTAVVTQDVARLQVAVQDTALVGVVHCTRHARQQLDGFGRWHGTGHGAAVQPAHRTELPALVFDESVDRNNVGVIQGGDDGGLGREAASPGVRGELSVEDHLQRHEPVEAALARAVDDTHGSTAGFGDQLEITDGSERRAIRRKVGLWTREDRHASDATGTHRSQPTAGERGAALGTGDQGVHYRSATGSGWRHDAKVGGISRRVDGARLRSPPAWRWCGG